MDDAVRHHRNNDIRKSDGSVRPRNLVLMILSIQLLLRRCEGFRIASLAAFNKERPPTWQTPRTTALRSLAVEDVVSVVTSSNALWHQHLPTMEVLLGQLYPTGATTTSTVVATILPSVPTTASNLRPATGHSQPLFGPPDPYLTAGKSIAPSSQTLLDMGIDFSSTTGDLRVVDAAKIHPMSALPGFAPTRGIFPTAIPLPSDTPETALINTQWSVSLVDVLDTLPQVAFLYALVEFFILRPNINLYKEDIEAEPGTVTFEWATAALVRLAIVSVIALITNGLF